MTSTVSSIPTAGGTAVAPDIEERLPTALKMSWGVGSMGAAVLMNTIGALVIFYLVKVVGMEAWIAGLLLTLARVYDAVSDPFMGHVSDRSPAKFGGRRRPYLLLGAFLSAAAILMVFNVPFSGASTAGIVYVLCSLLFFGTAYSVFNVPYITMPAEMTTGYHERSSIHAWRVIFSGLGIAVAGSGSGLLLAWLSKQRGTVGQQVNVQSDYTIIAGLYAVIIFVTMFIAWRGTRSAAMTTKSETTLPWKAQLSTFIGNKPFMTIMGVKSFQLIGVSAHQAGQFFMLVEVMGRSSAQVALVGLPSIVVSLFAAPLLVKLSRNFGKRAGYIISASFTGLSYLSWAVAQPDEPIWMLVVRGVILGVGFAGNVLFAMSMITDAIELDTHRSGLRREGMYTAFFSFVEKFTGAVGPTLVGVALSMAGFSKNAQVTPETYEQVRNATLIGVSYVPAFCALLGVLLLTRYRLDAGELQRARAAAAKPA
jgi:glycoside/pentoside/hexuronide:cation symporter, GPH family